MLDDGCVENSHLMCSCPSANALGDGRTALTRTWAQWLRERLCNDIGPLVCLSEVGNGFGRDVSNHLAEGRTVGQDAREDAFNRSWSKHSDIGQGMGGYPCLFSIGHLARSR